MEPISDSVYEVLVRQGIAAGRVGARTDRGMTASSLAALSFMGRANALLDREGDEAHSPTAGGGFQPMRIRGKRTPTEAGAKFTGGNVQNAQEPSSSPKARPVPRIVVDNGRNWRTLSPRVAPLGVRQFLALVK